MNDMNQTIRQEQQPVETSNEPIRHTDAIFLAKLDELLSAQIPVSVELPDGTRMPFDQYDEPLHRDGEVSVLAEDDGDEARPKTRAALEQMAQDGIFKADEIEAVLDELRAMGGLTDASVLTNVCKSDWGSSS